MPFAHSENQRGEKQDLGDHLAAVARLASEFAEKFGAADLGHWAGLWHDLGKFHPDFQAYLSNPVATRGPDHKGAGALLASRICDGLAFLIRGHHGGLPAVAELKAWLREKITTPRTTEALAIARRSGLQLDPEKPLGFPVFFQTPLNVEFFLRMLFSALVDADFLDTEHHFNPEKSTRRAKTVRMEDLWRIFEENQITLSGRRADRLNCIRHEVYVASVNAAEQPPGFFRLTVPTGGGKTRSALAFALKHTCRFGFERMVVGIPYTSIIEQTADEYRKIFGEEAVLEHHSAVSPAEDPENPTPVEIWSRLASENWDAPIIVTTTVQLFESLFANRPAKCRKLHNLARSVLILDEVQTLPTRLLDPILDALRELVAHYQVSVLLCTATQPALDERAHLHGLPNVREIAPDPGRLFRDLQRVTYACLRNRLSWGEVAAEMRNQPQALAVLNTKKDAIALLDALGDPTALHLSTLLCGAHRRDVLDEVKRRLRNGEPCRLVSTQVVEAGVDLDFPVVLRAVGPLDRIVQAAGRCNREGRLDPGQARVIVFDPSEGGSLPRGEYQTATDNTRVLLQSSGFDFHDPAGYETYFRQLYQLVDLDAAGIQAKRQRLNYPAVAENFCMINDDTVPVVVHYRGPVGDKWRADELLSALRARPDQFNRQLLRQLQPYLVSVRAGLLPSLQANGLVTTLLPGLAEWQGQYDSIRGVTFLGPSPDLLVV
jgi:CRISPR-associated endonuclease/helicase Cas3